MGGRNGFLLDGVLAMLGRLFPRSAKHNANNHLLLEAAWDEFPVNGSRCIGLGFAVRHVGDHPKGVWGEGEVERVGWNGVEWNAASVSSRVQAG